VAHVLVNEPTVAAVEDEKAFIAKCLAIGEQYRRQERVRSPEAVSKPLFATALQLANHRDLTRPGPGLEERRAQFVAELTDVARRLDIIEDQTHAAMGPTIGVESW
jgi:glycerol-3-phosphate O-acyltransferase